MKELAIALVAAHFIGDWICQPRWMALNKSKDFQVLFHHLMIVNTILSFVIFYPYHGYPLYLVWFWLTNTIAHGIIDWYIWRVYMMIRGENALELLAEVEEIPHESSTIAGDYFIEYRVKNQMKGYDRTAKHDYGFYTTIAIDQFLHLTILFLLFL